MPSCQPYLQTISMIAHYGMMGSRRSITLGCGNHGMMEPCRRIAPSCRNQNCPDFTQLRPDHFSSLMRYMTEEVILNGISGNLSDVYSLLNCKELELKNITVSKRDSRILLNMMINSVKELRIFDCRFVNFSHLTEYNDQGCCLCIIITMPPLSDEIGKICIWGDSVNWVCWINPCVVGVLKPPHPVSYLLTRRKQNTHEWLEGMSSYPDL